MSEDERLQDRMTEQWDAYQAACTRAIAEGRLPPDPPDTLDEEIDD